MRKLFFDVKAIKFLKKLDKKTKIRIMNKLERSKSNPEEHFARLKGLTLWKSRVGDYRIIASIEKSFIRILRIGHRKNVYKNLGNNR